MDYDKVFKYKIRQSPIACSFTATVYSSRRLITENVWDFIGGYVDVFGFKLKEK